MKSVATCILLLLCLPTSCEGVRLQPCHSGVVEVMMDSDSFDFTCDQYSGTVTWYAATYRVQYTIGTCSTSACQISSYMSQRDYTLTFLTPSSSRLTLLRKYTGRRYRRTYTCRGSDQDDCEANIVSHAIVPASGLTFTSTRWYVQGSSDVTSVFSSMGRYSCSWTETRDTVIVSAIPNVPTLTLTPDPSDIWNTQDRRGTCSFSKRLPTDDGNYRYTVVVSPGNTERTVGSVEIVRPVMPCGSCCTSPYVPGHNTSVVCTCNTQSVGRPEGRLRWFRGSGNNNPINTGNYGDTNLMMTPQMVTSADYDVTTFRCDVDWIETVSGENYRMGRHAVCPTAEVEESSSILGYWDTVISGVTAALLLLLLVTIIVFCCWLWRRGWVMPCADMGRQASAPPQPLATDADDYLAPTGLIGEPNTGPSGPYESLQMDDVGLGSTYAEISCRGNH